MKRSAGVVACMVIAGSAYAQPDAALAQLEHQLPAGWSMLATDTELVLRHDRPCYVRREVHENAPATARNNWSTGNRQQATGNGNGSMPPIPEPPRHGGAPCVFSALPG